MPPFARPVAAVSLLLVPAAVSAATQDTQAWFSQSLTAPIGNSNTLVVELAERARSAASDGDLYQYRIGADHTLAKGVSAGVSVVYIHSNTKTETRLMQQLDLTRGAWSSRTRLEQRMTDDSAITGWRLRQRVEWRLLLDHAKHWTLRANAEGFFTLNRMTPSDLLGLSALRTQIGVQRRVDDHLRLQLSWLRHQNFRPARADSIANAPWLTLNYSM
ncbi:DUF2490 domain-containing protein [Novosphingobium sp. FSY-8]|uniref:DUF2490 domain-containing protein n=1 Tax=Novosphingobium ovatum TaxID=1908523 RepID=A0ABW9XCP8_9SPHN|nr:DUF2490 domain-containing protein [Novosphingobium ovatum]NBC36314.1 DUF2490 domain-containing protein [Novosphingobium ovatum]